MSLWSSPKHNLIEAYWLVQLFYLYFWCVVFFLITSLSFFDSISISSNISRVDFSFSISHSSSSVAAVEFGTPNRITFHSLFCLFFCSHPTALKMFTWWFSEIFFLFSISISLHSVLVLLLFELITTAPHANEGVIHIESTKNGTAGQNAVLNECPICDEKDHTDGQDKFGYFGK